MSEIYSDSMAYEFSLGSRGNIDYCRDGDLTISSLTDNYPFDEEDWQWVSKNLPQLDKETWKDFVRVNSWQVPFPNNLDLGCKYTLLDVEKNPPEWALNNCVGVYSFSQIGFNSNMSQALVYHVWSCGYFAYGNLYYAEIVDNLWKVTNMVEVVIT